jgi:methionyl-tRNA formyltransferase
MSAQVLYISDSSDWSRFGAEYVARAFPGSEIIRWSYGDPVPGERLAAWEGDWIISMKNDLILPPEVLAKARRGGVNFHPAPPQYRGLGGYSYALYNGDPTYGITCHQMTRNVDQGPIVRVLRFPLFSWDTMSSLRERTGAFCIALLYELVSYIESDQPLPLADETWGDKLFTRKEYNAFVEKLRASGVDHRCLR